MTRALVIKSYGDPQIAGAIVDGVTRAVTPLDAGEYAAVRAELARLRARDDIRAYGDEIRLETACRALAAKYPPERHGRLYGVILGAWGLVWSVVYECYRYLSAWNREG